MLAEVFKVPAPKVTFSCRQGGYYSDATHEIKLSVNEYLVPNRFSLNPPDTICHEFAHHLCNLAWWKAKKEYYDRPNRFGKPHRTWNFGAFKRWSPHGYEFRDFLMKIIKVWYGEDGVASYCWRKEYKGVASWGMRRMERMGLVKRVAARPRGIPRV